MNDQYFKCDIREPSSSGMDIMNLHLWRSTLTKLIRQEINRRKLLKHLTEDQNSIRSNTVHWGLAFFSLLIPSKPALHAQPSKILAFDTKEHWSLVCNTIKLVLGFRRQGLFPGWYWYMLVLHRRLYMSYSTYSFWCTDGQLMKVHTWVENGNSHRMQLQINAQGSCSGFRRRRLQCPTYTRLEISIGCLKDLEPFCCWSMFLAGLWWAPRV